MTSSDVGWIDGRFRGVGPKVRETRSSVTGLRVRSANAATLLSTPSISLMLP